MAILSAGASAAGAAASVANSAANLAESDAVGAAHLALQYGLNQISEDVAVAQKQGEWAGKV